MRSPYARGQHGVKVGPGPWDSGAWDPGLMDPPKVSK